MTPSSAGEIWYVSLSTFKVSGRLATPARSCCTLTSASVRLRPATLTPTTLTPWGNLPLASTSSTSR